MPEDQTRNSEWEFKYADLKVKKWDLLIKTMSALAIFFSIWFTYLQYTRSVEKEKLEREQRLKEETAQKEKDLQTTLRESQKPFLERQLQFYVEASSVAAKLATLPAGAPREEARKRFWQLYWGELSLVESQEVEKAMVQFANTLEQYERKAIDLLELQKKSLDLAHTCRKSLAESWGYGLSDLGQQSKSSK